MMTKWTRAAIAGFIASLCMFILLYLGIYVTGWAPFNITPSAAFLENLGVNIGPLPLIVHFFYGMFWSVVLVYIFENDVSVSKGLLMALALWLFMMIVYSPIIGWGMFGFGFAHLLGSDHMLYLRPGLSYLISTMILHLVYGTVIGWLNARWIKD